MAGTASTPSTYAGAELGFHGEVWGLPCDYEITADEPEGVAVRFQVRTVRMPFLLTRAVSLRKGEPILRFHESVVNEGKRELEFMVESLRSLASLDLHATCFECENSHMNAPFVRVA